MHLLCGFSLRTGGRLGILQYAADVYPETVKALSKSIYIASGIIVSVYKRNCIVGSKAVGTAKHIVKAAAAQIPEIGLIRGPSQNLIMKYSCSFIYQLLIICLLTETGIQVSDLLANLYGIGSKR